MNLTASTRSAVLDTVLDAASRFHARGEGQAVEGLEETTPEVASLLERELRSAHDWATSPAGQAEEADELEGEDDYVSHDPVISLVQAAMDEHGDQAPGGKPQLRLIAEVLGIRTRSQLDFVPPPSNDAFVHDLPAKCRVVLVGDWGTAKPRAREVARAIAAAKPDHIIHLGDIYPSGTRTRAQARFLDVWKQEVGDGPKFWAMNGNHEMNAGGVGYFQVVLPAWGQPASFFCLRNEHWKLIALDTAYRDCDLEPRQMPWLLHQLDGPGNNILLSHHQMFSVVDTRPFTNSHKLMTTMQPVVDTERIFAWFWGHEHRCLAYAREIEWGNYHARAIGHGGKRVRQVKDTDLHPELGPRLLYRWNVKHPTKETRAMNGFAVLDFDGPALNIDYVDQTGTSQKRETWPDAPMA